MSERSCPTCGASMSVAAEQQGIVAPCPQCGTPVAIPVAVGSASAPVGPGNGMATMAAVLGIIGLVPLLGLLPGLMGIVLGFMVLATRRPGKGMAIAGIVIPVTGFVLMSAIRMPDPELIRQVVCMNNMQAANQAVVMYTLDYSRPPADLDALVRDSLIEYKHLDCPSEGTPGTVDYFYYAPAASRLMPLAPRSGLPQLLMCEFRANHGGRGRTYVLTDGTVLHVDEAAFQSLLLLPHNTGFAAALRAIEGP